jgi:hypothetical protein
MVSGVYIQLFCVLKIGAAPRAFQFFHTITLKITPLGAL